VSETANNCRELRLVIIAGDARTPPGGPLWSPLTRAGILAEGFRLPRQVESATVSGDSRDISDNVDGHKSYSMESDESSS